jgi:peptide deformylase
MIHELVSSSDPILRQAMDKFDFYITPTDPIQLAKDLAETMIANDGLGLAANQIGLPYRAFAIKAEQVIVCFNPTIVSSSQEIVALEEGCLSYPNLYVKIKRSKSIRVRYTQPNADIVTKTFDGLTARIFQHELDHLNGKVYTSRASGIHLERARKLAKHVKKIGGNKPMSNEAKELWEWLKV